MTDTSSYVGQYEVKSPLIAQVAVGWSMLWDACLSLGGKHITGLRAAMGHHGKGQHPFHWKALNSQASSVRKHIVDHHKGELNLDQRLVDSNNYINLGICMSSIG